MDKIFSANFGLQMRQLAVLEISCAVETHHRSCSSCQLYNKLKQLCHTGPESKCDRKNEECCGQER